MRRKRKKRIHRKKNKYWQVIRGERHVEVKLVPDRGIMFGLKTNGRTDSILRSLPPTVRFEYNYQPLFGSEEYKLQEACLHPKDWLHQVTEEERDEWASKSNTC